MPQYTFKCTKCEDRRVLSMSIARFLDFKKKQNKCELCEGTLLQDIISIDGKVDKSKEEIIMESRDEIRKVVQKIHRGDSRAIRDIYGDKKNPYKR